MCCSTTKPHYLISCGASMAPFKILFGMHMEPYQAHGNSCCNFIFIFTGKFKSCIYHRTFICKVFPTHYAFNSANPAPAVNLSIYFCKNSSFKSYKAVARYLVQPLNSLAKYKVECCYSLLADSMTLQFSIC